MSDIIYLKGYPYYYYGTYDTWRDAYNVGRRFKRRKKANYYVWVLNDDIMGWKLYKLYTSKPMKWLK